MNKELSDLGTRIRARFPLATIEFDPALHEGGRDHVDVRLGDRLVVVEWDANRGFGISLVVDTALDSAPDFRVAEGRRALECVFLLLTEAQDAALIHQLGDQANPAAEIELHRTDRSVSKGDKHPPRSEAA